MVCKSRRAADSRTAAIPLLAMSESRKQKGKRPHRPVGGSSFSKSLRSVRDLLHAGKTEEGLSRLNKLANSSRNPATKGRIAAMIAVSESRLSRHHEARAAFARTSALGRQSGDLDLVVQGGIGEVRSLLRSLRLEEANASAQELIIHLEDRQQSFEQIASLSPLELETRGIVDIPARPPRLPVVLTKLATAYVESGHTAEAREFLQKAIKLSPNGASRARQMLAKLALAADQPELAERYAREALQMGRFQAKTIAAWQLYLDGRARQGLKPILEPLLFESLSAHAADRIYAASCLSISRVLRAHGDSYWKKVAAAALANKDSADPIVAVEIEKILHADAKLTLSETPITLAARSSSFSKRQPCHARSKSAMRKTMCDLHSSKEEYLRPTSSFDWLKNALAKITS